MQDNAVRFLIQAGCHAPSADNSQPWRFHWDGESIDVLYDRPRVDGLTFALEDPASLLAFGAVEENINQAAKAIGLRPTTRQRYPTSKSDLVLQLGFQGDADLKSDAYEHILFRRHTNRHPFKNTQPSPDLLSSLQDLRVNRARVLVFDDPSSVDQIADAVRRASEIRFQLPEVHKWLGRSLRFSQEEVQAGDGLDVATLDLPPGGRIAMHVIKQWRHMRILNKLGAYRALSAIDAKPVRQAPALVAIVAPAGPGNALDAGRLMERAWIFLNAHGLAVHPYYVISDQLGRLEAEVIPKELFETACLVRDRLPAVLSSENEKLYMLFRIGYPGRKPVVSRRLPLNRVFSDVSPELQT